MHIHKMFIGRCASECIIRIGASCIIRISSQSNGFLWGLKRRSLIAFVLAYYKYANTHTSIDDRPIYIALALYTLGQEAKFAVTLILYVRSCLRVTFARCWCRIRKSTDREKKKNGSAVRENGCTRTGIAASTTYTDWSIFIFLFFMFIDFYF